MRKALLPLLILLCLVAVACSVENGEKESANTNESPEREPPAEKPAGGGSESALVPVVHFTSAKENVTVEELSGTEDLAVPGGLEDRVGRLLEDPTLETFDSPSAVIDHVSQSPDAVGMVPWKSITSRVKALSVGGESPLESGGDYPFPGSGPEPKKLRKVVVGGDMVLDRGQSYTVIQRGKGLDYPLEGGYAEITSTTIQSSSASEFGVTREFEAERRGRSGAMKEYLNSADLTLANLENPVVEDAVWHPSAATFTGDPRLLPILEKASIDGVTLANNHILDSGVSGLRQTKGYLQEMGISYAGAGMDLSSAREPMIFDLGGGVEVGVLSYQGVPSYQWAWAQQATLGTAPLQKEVMVEDIRKLESEVDLTVVMPHWGQEYTATPEQEHVELAHAATKAGADLVVGGHAHWPKGMEFHRGAPIFYGVGNFLFDQSWSLETSTGTFAEATLYEDRIIQVRPKPFVILDRSQPNFLTEGGWRERTLQTIFEASRGDEFKSSGPGWDPPS